MAVLTIPPLLATAGTAPPGLVEALGLSAYSAGVVPPHLTGRTLDGMYVSMAVLRGRVVLLNFWASWCLECRPEMPRFEQLHRDLSAKGLTVLGVNVRERPEAIRAYARELRLTFPLLLDPDGSLGAAYGVVGLPTTFVIGRDGRAVARAIGPRDWAGAPARSLVESLLAEPAPHRERR